MDVQPVITGAGLITPIGSNLSENWEQLLAGAYIDRHARAKMVDDGSGACRVHQLARGAAREAMKNAGWKVSLVSDGSDEIAVIVGTSKGPIETWMTAPPSTSVSTSDKASGARIGPLDDFGLASIASDLRRHFQFNSGPTLTLAAACASGLHALIRGAMMIQSREVSRVLVVAAESSLHPLFVGSFKRLGVLAREEFGCRPFDQNREGFLMSEAAAAVCLEAGDSTDSRPNSVRIDGYAMGGDASHLTGHDPGMTLIRRLIRQTAGERPVDLVHAHGTGTPLNDAGELSAIEDSFNRQTPGPIVYSHKGAIGHTLGVAGLAAIVINCLAHAHHKVPGNIRTTTPLPTQRVQLNRDATERRIKRSIAVAAGFGGPAAVVSLTTERQDP